MSMRVPSAADALLRTVNGTRPGYGMQLHPSNNISSSRRLLSARPPAPTAGSACKRPTLPLPMHRHGVHAGTTNHLRPALHHAATTPQLPTNPALRLTPPALAAAAVMDPVAVPAAADQAASGLLLCEPVVIIGAGPAGLATALMLAGRGYTDIRVYERLAAPPRTDDAKVWANFGDGSERLYMIGINGRGQAALRRLGGGAMSRIEACSSTLAGRMDWKPDAKEPVTTLYAGRSYQTKCIQRDRLSSCLLEEIRAEHAGTISVEFKVECVKAEWLNPDDGHATNRDLPAAAAAAAKMCRLHLSRQDGGGSATGGGAELQPQHWEEMSHLVIGADGAGSSLRAAMQADSGGAVRVTRYVDKNALVYRTLPLFWPPGMAEARPGNLNYSSRTKSGINMDCLPTREGPLIGVVLFKPSDAEVHAVRDSADARALFERRFPMFMPGLRDEDLARFAAQRDSSLPTFSFAGPLLHHGDSAVLVGDTIHTVKPYFGQGVNSALEDVQVLARALDETSDDVPRALERYTQLRSEDAEALVKLSHGLDGGFLSFVLPLIADSMLHRLLPAIFSPNVIASLQNEQRSFSQVRGRKRMDRAMQVALLGALMFVLVKVVSGLVALGGKLMSGAAC